MNKSISEGGRPEYDKLFQEIDYARRIQNKQKSRGLNDYNIFTSLLKANDEVRLHSRFIYSLLNPEGTDTIKAHCSWKVSLRKLGLEILVLISITHPYTSSMETSTPLHN